MKWRLEDCEKYFSEGGKAGEKETLCGTLFPKWDLIVLQHLTGYNAIK
jgi:hypothetical protein